MSEIKKRTFIKFTIGFLIRNLFRIIFALITYLPQHLGFLIKKMWKNFTVGYVWVAPPEPSKVYLDYKEGLDILVEDGKPKWVDHNGKERTDWENYYEEE